MIIAWALLLAARYSNGQDELVSYFEFSWGAPLWPLPTCEAGSFPACDCLSLAVEALDAVGAAGYLYFFAHVPVMIVVGTSTVVVYRESRAVQVDGDSMLAIRDHGSGEQI